MRKWIAALTLALGTVFGAMAPAHAAQEGDQSWIDMYDGESYWMYFMEYRNGQWVVWYEMYCGASQCGSNDKLTKAK